MKRFFNNDGQGNGEGFNYEDDDDDEDGDEELEEGFKRMTAAEYLDQIQMDLVEIDLNQKLLREAIEIAKKDIFWWFRTPEEKSAAIDTIYQRLSVMMDGGLIMKPEPKDEE